MNSHRLVTLTNLNAFATTKILNKNRHVISTGYPPHPLGGIYVGSPDHKLNRYSAYFMSFNGVNCTDRFEDGLNLFVISFSEKCLQLYAELILMDPVSICIFISYKGVVHLNFPSLVFQEIRTDAWCNRIGLLQPLDIVVKKDQSVTC